MRPRNSAWVMRPLYLAMPPWPNPAIQRAPKSALLRGLALGAPVGRQRIGREAPVERRHRAGLEVTFSRPHQDHRRRCHQIASVVGPRRTAHRPRRAPIVEEGRAEILERELAPLGRQMLAHALVAIDR